MKVLCIFYLFCGFKVKKVECKDGLVILKKQQILWLISFSSCLRFPFISTCTFLLEEVQRIRKGTSGNEGKVTIECGTMLFVKEAVKEERWAVYFEGVLI